MKKMLVVLLAFVLSGCGAETLAIIFIPAFAATWNVEGDPEYRIDLQPNDDNKKVRRGVFPGDEFHDSDSDRNNNDLSGSFDQLDIEFTIQRPNNVKIQYVGKMVPISDTDHTIVRIVLNSSEGPLVLIP